MPVQSQDITGTWEEYTETRFTNYTRLCIVNICGKYVGYTYDSDMDSGHCKADFAGNYNSKRKQLRGETFSFIEQTPGHMLTVLTLYYSTKNNEEYLEGTVYMKPDSADFRLGSEERTRIKESARSELIQFKKTRDWVDSTVYMRLIASRPCKTTPVADSIPVVVTPLPPEIIEPAVIVKPEEKPVKPPPTALSPQELILQMQATRTNDTLFDIPTTEKELFIKVLDNAITDGDTISILHNKKLIAEKIQVAARAFPLKIQLSKESPYHELVLVAHNLGSIPPNTALLLVTSGGREYRLNAFADLTKNAVIIFRYMGQ